MNRNLARDQKPDADPPQQEICHQMAELLQRANSQVREAATSVLGRMTGDGRALALGRFLTVSCSGDTNHDEAWEMIRTSPMLECMSACLPHPSVKARGVALCIGTESSEKAKAMCEKHALR